MAKLLKFFDLSALMSLFAIGEGFLQNVCTGACLITLCPWGYRNSLVPGRRNLAGSADRGRRSLLLRELGRSNLSMSQRCPSCGTGGWTVAGALRMDDRNVAFYWAWI